MIIWLTRIIHVKDYGYQGLSGLSSMTKKKQATPRKGIFASASRNVMRGSDCSDYLGEHRSIMIILRDINEIISVLLAIILMVCTVCNDTYVIRADRVIGLIRGVESRLKVVNARATEMRESSNDS